METRKGRASLYLALMLLVFSLCAAVLVGSSAAAHSDGSAATLTASSVEQQSAYASLVRPIIQPREAIEDDGDSYRPPARPPNPRERIEDDGTKDMAVTITISPQNTPQVFVGEKFEFIASIRTSVPVSSAPRAIWAVTGGIGTIDSRGVFTATNSGTGAITATYNGTTEALPLTVNSATMSVNPGSATIYVGDSVHFQESIRTDLPVATAPSATWSVDGGDVKNMRAELAAARAPISRGKATVGTIDSSGVFTATAPGTGTVRAVYENAETTAAVTVLAAPQASRIDIVPSSLTIQSGQTEWFTATVYDENNSVMNVVPTWSVTGGIGTIDEYGMFAGTVAGNGTVVVAYDNVSSSASVEVIPGWVASIGVVPDNAALTVGEGIGFAIIGYDSYNNTASLAGARTTWAVDGGMGTVSPSSGSSTVFTATNAGNGTVCARTIVLARHWALKAPGLILRDCADVLVYSNATMAYVDIVPASADLNTGDTVAFEVFAYDANNSLVSLGGTTQDWSVANATVGTLSSTSGSEVDFTGIWPGDTQVCVDVEDALGTIYSDCSDARVRDACPVRSVTLSPATATFVINQGYQFSYALLDANGQPVTSVTPAWSVTGGIGTVNETGSFIASNVSASGTVSLSACNASADSDVAVIDIGSISVVPQNLTIMAGGTQDFGATIYDGNGNSVQIPDGTRFWWGYTTGLGTVNPVNNSLNTTFTASTTPVNGLLCGILGVLLGQDPSIPGPQPAGRIYSNCSNVSVVSAARIEIVPTTLTIQSGQSEWFTATVYNESNSVMNVTPAWSVTGGIGVIGADGMFNATIAGNGTVVATYGNMSGSAGVEVIPGWLARIDVVPDNAVMLTGSQIGFAIVGYDSYNNTANLSGSRTTWAVDGGMGNVSPSFGSSTTFTATNEGNGTVCARTITFARRWALMAPGLILRDCANVSVYDQWPIARVEIAPTNANLVLNQQQAFTATAYDIYNQPVAVPFTWSTDGGIGTITVGNVSSNADFLATNNGTGNVTADYDGLNATASITVDAYGAPGSIEVLPPHLGITVADSRQFEAEVSDAYGNIVPNQPIAWSVAGTIGTISPTGYFTAGNQTGSGWVIATLGALSDNATVTVSSGGSGGGGGGGGGGTGGGTTYCAKDSWYCDADVSCCSGLACIRGVCVQEESVPECLAVGSQCGGAAGTNCCDGTCVGGSCKLPANESDEFVTVVAPEYGVAGTPVSVLVLDGGRHAISVDVEVITPSNRRITISTSGDNGASYVPEDAGKYGYEVKGRRMTKAVYTYVSDKPCIENGNACTSNSDCCTGRCDAGKCAAKVTELKEAEKAAEGTDIGLMLASFFGNLSGLPAIALIAVGVLLVAGGIIIAVNSMPLGEKKEGEEKK